MKFHFISFSDNEPNFIFGLDIQLSNTLPLVNHDNIDIIFKKLYIDINTQFKIDHYHNYICN